MRNRLCALASASGGYGFTCGVEWLAPERLNVHGSRGLAWGNGDNLVDELSRLTQLLASHPCFFDGAGITRAQPRRVIRRFWFCGAIPAEGLDTVLAFVNTDVQASHTVSIKATDYDSLGASPVDLLSQKLPGVALKKGAAVFTLEAGAAFAVFAARPKLEGGFWVGTITVALEPRPPGP